MEGPSEKRHVPAIKLKIPIDEPSRPNVDYEAAKAAEARWLIDPSPSTRALQPDFSQTSSDAAAGRNDLCSMNKRRNFAPIYRYFPYTHIAPGICGRMLPGDYAHTA